MSCFRVIKLDKIWLWKEKIEIFEQAAFLWWGNLPFLSKIE